MDNKRPLVYSTLQLGRSWDDAICNFLGDIEVDTVTRPQVQFVVPVMMATA